MNKLLTYGTNPWADNNQHVAVTLGREDNDSFYIYPLPGADATSIIFLLRDKEAAAKFASLLRQCAMALEQHIANL